MKAKLRRRLFYLGIAVISLLFILVIFDRVSKPIYRFNLPQIEEVDHGIRFNVKPLRLSKDGVIVFLRIESYEHPNILKQPILDTTLLLLSDDRPVVPTKWSVIKDAEGIIEGEVLFPGITKEDVHDTLTFMIFEPHEYRFSWDISPSSNVN